MQETKTVSTPDAPAAIGPYSQAVICDHVVYCSGQIALDPANGEIVEGGIEEQTRQVLHNLTHVLEAAGSGLDRVLKTTVYLQTMEEFPRMNEVYAGFFPASAPPARATVEVARLPRDVRVEIDCIATLR